MRLMGRDVIINPMCDNVPRMSVSKSFADLMPKEFVDDLNAWMLQFFGTTDHIYELGGTTLVMGPRTIDKIIRRMPMP